MDLDSVDAAFVDSLIPEGAVPTGLCAVVTWLDPNDDVPRWRCYIDVDLPVTTTLGFLELAKLDVIARSNTGLPIQYPKDDDG
jgi:hypothetical protein